MSGFSNFYALYKYVLHSQPQKNEESSIGFIYFDNTCGVTENYEGKCILINDKLKMTKNYAKEENSRLVLRISNNPGRNYYILDNNQTNELGLPLRPDWLDFYSKPSEEYIRKIEFLHPFKCSNYPDDVQVLLPPNQEKHHEIVWVRLFKLRDDNTFEGILLNQPHQDFHINKNDHVTIIPLLDKNKKNISLVCKNTIDDSSKFAEWMKDISNAFEIYQTSLVKFDTLLSENKNDAKTWFEKADLFHVFSQYELAINSYNQGILLDPNNELAWFAKAWGHQVMGHFDQALDAYDMVIKINPSSLYALCNKGAIINELGRFEEANGVYDHALTIEPYNTDLLMNKGLGLMNLEQYYKAIEIFDKIISIVPDSAPAWCKKGKTYLLLNQFDESISCFDKALSFDSDNLEAHEYRDSALSQQQNKK